MRDFEYGKLFYYENEEKSFSPFFLILTFCHFIWRDYEISFWAGEWSGNPYTTAHIKQWKMDFCFSTLIRINEIDFSTRSLIYGNLFRNLNFLDLKMTNGFFCTNTPTQIRRKTPKMSLIKSKFTYRKLNPSENLKLHKKKKINH